jgi:hypothetical protein
MGTFFIVGSARSGTTMLQQALARHSRIVIPPETAFFANFLDRSRSRQRHQIRQINTDLKIALTEPGKRVTCDEDARTIFQEMARQYLARVGAAEETLFGEKTPRHLRNHKRIFDLFPEARIIVIYRDGRDVALSLAEAPWGPNDVYYHFARWLTDMRWQQRLKAERSERVHCVQYEALVARPEQELRRLAEFLDLAYEPAMAEGYGQPQDLLERERGWKARAVEAITTSRTQRWRRELSEAQNAYLERWGGGVLRSMGYETITDGRRRLPVTFFPRLYARQLAWKAYRALRSARLAWSGS